MTESLSEEDKAKLVAGYASGEIAEQNKAIKKVRPEGTFKDKVGSRPPVVVKNPAVYKPLNWFGSGKVKGGS